MIKYLSRRCWTSVDMPCCTLFWRGLFDNYHHPLNARPSFFVHTLPLFFLKKIYLSRSNKSLPGRLDFCISLLFSPLFPNQRQITKKRDARCNQFRIN
ncbi:hypothetical protein PUN28_005081 [Cardiocondyla obscurior]|uniref:Uncharacterized protein n=1 Tax=Cardiocondyla obscurior TaxID=286306 RepID=A0AAW2GH47_9HYME